MTVGIFITARMTSTRLPGKSLLPVDGVPILGVLLKRIVTEFQPEIGSGEVKVVISTSEEPINRQFETHFGNEVTVFGGSPANIPLRHLQTARHHGVAAVVSVDGDDILCSVAAMRRVYDQLRSGATYVKTTRLPLGMNSMGYSTPFLERALRGHSDQPLETGWSWIFADEPVRVEEIDCVAGDDPRLRLTLDYREDFEFFVAVIRALGDDVYRASDEAIVQTILARELFKLNEAVGKAYWENFHAKANTERGNARES